MTLAVPFSLEVAGAVANQARRRSFNRKRGDPSYRGPIIVAEGDSWFCYPIEFPLTPAGSPKDVILQLQDEFAILDVGVPGALAFQYRDQFFGFDGQGGLHLELRTHQPDILLLSGGGNDLLGDLEAHLPSGDRPLEQYLAGGFRKVMNGVVEDLEWVARESVKAVTRTDLAVILNGYDEALPGAGGDWLRGPMTRLGIPRAKHEKLVNLMVKRFNDELQAMVERLTRDFGATLGRFAVADTVGVSGRRWYNEIHPNTAAFSDIARRYRGAILRAFPLVA